MKINNGTQCKNAVIPKDSLDQVIDKLMDYMFDRFCVEGRQAEVVERDIRSIVLSEASQQEAMER